MIPEESPPGASGRASQQALGESGEHRAVISMEGRVWSGPLPPPEVVAQFGAVVENGAKRVFAEWESEARHRRFMDAFERVTSRCSAFVFSILALGAAAYCASVGHPWPAAVIGSGTVAAVVWAFTANLQNTTRR